MTDDYRPDLAYRHAWRRHGLILVPVGVTAQDRFGDVIADQRAAEIAAEQEAS